MNMRTIALGAAALAAGTIAVGAGPDPTVIPQPVLHPTFQPRIVLEPWEREHMLNGDWQRMSISQRTVFAAAVARPPAVDNVRMQLTVATAPPRLILRTPSPGAFGLMTPQPEEIAIRHALAIRRPLDVAIPDPSIATRYTVRLDALCRAYSGHLPVPSLSVADCSTIHAMLVVRMQPVPQPRVTLAPR